MNRIVSYLLSLMLITAITSIALSYSSSKGLVDILWSNPMAVNDVAVSEEGNYLAVVNDTGLYYFDSRNPNPLWWYETSIDEHFKSVAISADGIHMVVGDDIDVGYIYYFADADEKSGLVVEPTWMSVDLGGSIERGALDISDDGDYVVAGVLTTTIHYFDDCTTRLGPRQSQTWFEEPLDGIVEVLAVDMSSDGKYVGVGGSDSDSGFVVFYKDAWSGPESKWIAPGWVVLTYLHNEIKDLAVSDDGYAVAAVEKEGLYYWADAKTLTGEPHPTWVNEGPYSSVDMNSDGDKVVAGFIVSGTVFFKDARDLPGPIEEPTWNKLVGEEVLNVVITDEHKSIIAAITGGISEDRAFFFTHDGSLIGEFDLDGPSPIVSKGSIRIPTNRPIIVAVGSLGPNTLVLYGIVTFPVGGEILPIDIGAILMTNLYFLTAALLVVTILIAIIVKKRR